MSVSIDAVMTEVNNHFAISAESNVFEIVSDGIKGTFTDTYIVGQYVWIKDSRLNDGVYKVTEVETDKLTFEDTDLLAEKTDDYIRLFGLSPSKTFITLASDISTYDGTLTKGIKSESQGNRSVTYGTQDGDGTWQSVYKSQLNAYRRMFDDDTRRFSYNINTKGW